ncbi:MAG: helix-turn-helix domain-containing protein [Massilibacteroides sp.]|nr:helix-turn-helix domain-containing protein [Massilibacteroides sp.]
MNEQKTISEILTDYFFNSQENFAVDLRNHFAYSRKSANQEAMSYAGDSASTTNPLTDKLEDWFDNQDVMQVLHISPRTLQTLRSNGILPFSRIGNKLYYRRFDIQKLLSNNYTLFKICDYGKRK